MQGVLRSLILWTHHFLHPLQRCLSLRTVDRLDRNPHIDRAGEVARKELAPLTSDWNTAGCCAFQNHRHETPTRNELKLSASAFA